MLVAIQAAPVAAPPPSTAVKVVPLFRVKDKRTIEEVQAVRCGSRGDVRC